jgi:hypothetical protein
MGERRIILLCKVETMARVSIDPSASEAEAIQLALDLKNSPNLTWEKQKDLIVAIEEK